MLERAEDLRRGGRRLRRGCWRRYGQGGNCELRGNSHFDSSYLVSDRTSAYVIETAGRDWAAREVEGRRRDLQRHDHRQTTGSAALARRAANGARIDFPAPFEDEAMVAAVGAHQRQTGGL